MKTLLSALFGRVMKWRGRTKRVRHQQEFSATATGTASMVAVKIHNGSATAVRNVGPIRSSSADLDDAGQLASSIEGAPPENETDSFEVCNRLVEHMNADGGHWSLPEKSSDKRYDGKTSEGSEPVYIQVVRIPEIGGQRIWHSLDLHGHVNSALPVEAAADDLRGAIKVKERIPLAERPSTLLAIDAGQTSGHTLPRVVESFRTQFGAEVRALGFKAVWVVGPTTALTARLDCKFARNV